MNIDEVRNQFHLNNFYRRSIIDKKFSECGIYFGQPPILEFLSQNPDSAQKEIADHLDISPASVAVSVKRMEKSGLVMRVADKSDARRKCLRITDKGLELLQFAHQTFDSIDTVMLSGLNNEEINLLVSFLKKINNNLSNLIPEKKEGKNA